jgi:hypothetical protein
MISMVYQCDLCGDSWSQWFADGGQSDKRLHPIGMADGTFLDICSACKEAIDQAGAKAREQAMQARRKA